MRPTFPRRLVGRAPVALSAAALAIASLLPATPVVAGPPPKPTISVQGVLHSCFVSGSTSLGGGDTLVIKHRRADGTLRTTHTIPLTGGSWVIPCPNPRLAPGDKLQFFEQGETTPFRVFTVPRLRLTLDRVADKIRGAAPGTPDEVSLLVTTCTSAGSDCEPDPIVPITPGPDGGTFSRSRPISARNAATLYWTRGADSIELWVYAARLLVMPGRPTVLGWGGTIGERVKVTLTRGTRIGTARPKVDESGFFEGTIRRNGSPMTIKVGDVISAPIASDATLKVPPFNLWTSEDAINGRCFKGGEIDLRVLTSEGGLLAEGTAQAESEFGTWTRETGLLERGRQIQAWCANKKGDILYLETTVP
jgi:hypothetical protein